MRILLVDDHTVMREALAFYLEGAQNLRVVAQAGSAAQAREVAARVDFDVAVLDIGLPGEDGVSLLQHLREEEPGLPVVLFTGITDVEVVRRALDAGATVYVPKVATQDDLIAAIHAASEGRSWIHPAVSESLVKLLSRPAAADGPGGELSPRELEVLHLLAEGLTNREIAERLVVTVDTTKSHVSAILGKLDVKTRTRAAAVARERGLLRS